MIIFISRRRCGRHKSVLIITEQHTIVLPSYVLEELKRVIKRKFSQKYALLDKFIQELPFTLAYTPEKIDAKKYPEIRDKAVDFVNGSV
ncbi:MAG: hypothetical protein DDT21_00427 [Syntrophomonadaceae bacterium]|nr:hypothetical protein [Bacillota bacterium]